MAARDTRTPGCTHPQEFHADLYPNLVTVHRTRQNSGLSSKKRLSKPTYTPLRRRFLPLIAAEAAKLNGCFNLRSPIGPLELPGAAGGCRQRRRGPRGGQGGRFAKLPLVQTSDPAIIGASFQELGIDVY